MNEKTKKIAIVLLSFIVVSCSSPERKIPSGGNSQFSDNTFSRLSKARVALQRSFEGYAQDSNKYMLSHEIDAFLEMQLEKGKFIASSTSSSSNKYYKSAEKLLEYLKSISESEKTLDSQVVTKISHKPKSDYIIQYVSFKDYEGDHQLWRSYNYGMMLPIKTYIFRVSNKEEEYIEPVVVWDNPSVLTINVGGR